MDAIKRAVNVNLKPNLNLPHISLSGSLSLNPPSVPKISVAWYSKGAIFKRPTVFGGMGVGRVLPTLNRAKSKKATFVAKALFNAMNMLTSR